jgi:uncharacterized sulfatase
MMTDTQRKDMLSCYNKSLDMNTPFLDGIAEKGMMFNRAYTAQPVCGPARSALFTGTYPHTNGCFANSIPLGQTTKTLGQRVMQSNIRTAYVGKWHLDGGDYFGDGQCPEGWDPEYWFDMRNYLDKMSDEDRFISRQFESVFNQEIPPSFTYAHQCSDKAIEFLEKHKDEDFLLVVSYDEPHHPFISPSAYFDMFKNRNHTQYGNVNQDLSNHPEHVQIWAKSIENIDPTASALMGCNAYVDKEIGRVLEAIDTHVNGACIIYTSDHGAGLGAHGLSDKGPAMYDEITNIPLIIKIPHLIAAKQVNNHPVSHVDLVPTILDLLEIEKPMSLEGHSLLPTLMDHKVKVTSYAFMEFGRYEVDHDGFGGFQPIRAVTDGRFKLSINLLTTDELYDTVEDQGEMNNLLMEPEYMEKRNELHDALLDWMNITRDPFRGYYWERRTWRLDAREATWDYTGMTRQRVTGKDEVGQLDYATGLPIKTFVRKK